jgi:hypothetical protein
MVGTHIFKKEGFFFYLSCRLNKPRQLILLFVSKAFFQQNFAKVSRFTMLDTPVPIQTLKLSNIGPGYYLDGRPSREFQVLLAPIPLPPPPAVRVQSFQTLFVSIK